jgi:S1-C subfamily serine protease
VQLSTWEGTDFNATVSATSSGPDLAELGRSDVPSGTTAAPLASADPVVGSAVWVAGYPEGDQLTVVPGEVIDYISGAALGIPNDVMEISDVVKPGNSGSALVDSTGTVVGVVFATRVSNGEGLAIPVSELSSFLASPGSEVLNNCAD